MVFKANKSLNVIRTLTKISYGAHPNSMLNVYRGLTWAFLEWAAAFIANTSRFKLKTLDRVQYAALRAVLGCMRTTPIPILLSEASEPPLKSRRKLLINKNLIRLVSWSENPITRRIGQIMKDNHTIKQKPKYLTEFSLIKLTKQLVILSPQVKNPKNKLTFIQIGLI